MRHAISGNKLGRNSSLRKATVRDIAKATIIQERICTTKAKAKEARKLADRLITLGKKGTLAHRRQAFSILCDHKLVSQLFNEIAPRFRQRSGGYTRIIPLANRRGDNAELVFLELTEKKEIILSKPKSSATTKAKVSGITQEKKTEVVAEDAVIKEEKKAAPKKASSKSTTPKVTKEKAKSSKKIVGGIKNMFRRKKTD